MVHKNVVNFILYASGIVLFIIVWCMSYLLQSEGIYIVKNVAESKYEINI